MVPSLVRATCDEVDAADPLLGILRPSYPGFDGWLAKCATEGRPCVLAPDGPSLAGLAIAKERPGRVKLCALAVSSDHRRRGLGGSLLRAVLGIAGDRPVHLTIRPHRPDAVRLALRHGFVVARTLPDGDLRLERPASG